MGTSYNIKYINGDEFPESKEIHTETIQATWRSKRSDVSINVKTAEPFRFNQHKGADAFEALSKLRRGKEGFVWTVLLKVLMLPLVL